MDGRMQILQLKAKCRNFICGRPEEHLNEVCLVPSAKHGKETMIVYCYFAGLRTGDVLKITGKNGKQRILGYLAKYRMSIRKPYSFTFQKENDQKCTVKVCRYFLEKRRVAGEVSLMIWPFQSAYLSPIVNCYERSWTEKRKHKHTHTLIPITWMIISLISGMPRVCEAVMRANGGHPHFYRCILLGALLFGLAAKN